MKEIILYNKDKLLKRIDNINNIDAITKYDDLYPFFYVELRYQNNDLFIDFISSSIASLGYDYYSFISSNYNFSKLFSKNGYEHFRSIIQYYVSNRLSDFNCTIDICDTNGNTFPACADGKIVYEDETKISIMLVAVTEDDENSSNLLRISSLLHSKNYGYAQNYLSSDGKLTYKYYSLGVKKYLTSEMLFNGSDLFSRYVGKEEYRRVFNELHDINFNEHHNITIAFRLNPSDYETYMLLTQNYVNTQKPDQRLYESIVFDVTSHEHINAKLRIHQKALEANLKRTELISDVLNFFQTSSDFLTSLKSVMSKIARYFDISYIHIYFPTPEADVYTQFIYGAQDNTFEKKHIYASDFNSRYNSIIKNLAKYGTAYCDRYGATQNCLKEFHKDCDYAFLVYKITVENYCDGFFTLIDKDKERYWDKDTLAVISDICQIMSGVFSRFYSQRELSTTIKTFKTVLNNIDSYVCVSDLDEDRIVFTNQKFDENFKSNPKGKRICDCLGIDEDELEYILKKNYNDKNEKRATFYEIFCPKTNQWIDLSQVNITWVDGQVMKLSTLNNITQKIEYEKIIETQAMKDHLTGLPNRRKLEKDFNALVEKSIANDSFGYILFLDLDNFKNVNDGLGHHYGDALLVSISEYLKELEYTGKYSYRFGGDEFVILLPDDVSSKIDTVINTIFERFQQQWELIDTTYFCTMSMGIARYPYDGTTLFELLKKVDMAMYNAKNQGKNRALFYKSKIGSDSIRNIELQRYLRESISDNCHDFYVCYQPVVNSKTQKVIGAEALLRWECENLGNVSPSEFIPLAEKLGLIIPLGDFVMKQACRQCKKMIDLGSKDFRMGINLSVEQILEKNFVTKALATIKGSGIAFSNINLEITESLAIHDFEEVSAIIFRLSSYGIEISLDDFGTGYSSLNNIKELPLNIIKIDKSFVDDLYKNNTEVFVKMIINLAHELGMEVCAEGVETVEQYHSLLKLDTDLIQGYFFGKPIKPDEFEALCNNLR